MRYFSLVLLGLTLWACDNSDNNNDGTAGMGGDAASGGVGGSAGVIACGAHLCGACDEGCSANDECVDGEWQCRCDCGGGGQGGAVSCGPSACGPCEEGCSSNDQCVNGEWQCGCDCGDGGQGGNTGQSNDCGPMDEESCPANCALMQTCVDGAWDTYCECGIPPCFTLCEAWSSNLDRCVDGFEETEAYLTSCQADCEALTDEAVLRTFADCTAQLEECSTLLVRCSEYVPNGE